MPGGKPTERGSSPRSCSRSGAASRIRTPSTPRPRGRSPIAAWLSASMPVRDEALELRARAVDHAERRVLRVGELRRDLDDPLEQGVERELRGERTARLEQASEARPGRSMRCPRADPRTEANALRARQRVSRAPAAGNPHPVRGSRRWPSRATGPLNRERPTAEDGGCALAAAVDERRDDDEMSSTATAGAPVDVILKDGGTLRLRPPLADDAEALVEFFTRLSDRSLYLRFHGFQPVGRRLVEPYLEPDWAERGALVGTLARADGPERIVALASYARLRDPAAAEVAFAVADEEQGRGIGTRLLEQLALRGRRARHLALRRGGARRERRNARRLRRRRLRGRAQARGRRGRAPLPDRRDREPAHAGRRAGPRRRHRVAAAVLRAAQRRRDRRLGARRLDRRRPLPQHRPRRLRGRGVSGEQQRHPGAGRARLPLDRRDRGADRARRHLRARRAACSTRPSRRSPPASARSASSPRASPRRAPRASSGRSALLALVRAHGARLVGPNCLGIAVSGAHLEATFAARPLPPGRIGFSSQSGALGLALLEAAAGRGLGFSSFVSIGNKADVSSNDLLEWWDEDDGTDLVLALPRVVREPAHVRPDRAARRRHKPILALKAGSTGAGAGPRAHTPRRSPRRTRAVDALFRQAGVLRARTLEELIDAAALLSSQPLPQRPARRRADERGRPRHPLRRRVRRRTGWSCPSSRPRRAPRWRRCSRPRRASRTRSTCSARRPRRPTRR